MSNIERDDPEHKYPEYLASVAREAELRAALEVAERELAAEREAHARLKERHAKTAAELADARREAAIRSAASAARSRELDDRRRELQAERTAHGASREALARAEASQAPLVEAIAGLQARLDRCAPELEATRARLVDAQGQIEALHGELTQARERVERAAQAHADEALAHAETRRRLQDALAGARTGGLRGWIGRLPIVRAVCGWFARDGGARAGAA